MAQPPSRSILLLTRGVDRVGTGSQVAIAAEALAAAGWHPTVALTSAGGGLRRDLRRAGIDLVALGNRPRPDWGAGAALARLLRRRRPRAVLAWGRGQARLAAAALVPAPGPRLVTALALPPAGAADRLAVGRSDRLIASAPAVAAACAAAGFPVGRIDTVVPGSPAPAPRSLDRTALAAGLGLDPARIWTLCVAPLVPAARLSRLVWAIDQLGVVHRGLDHLLVGAGPLESRLARRARAQRIADRLVVVPTVAPITDLLAEVGLVWQSGSVAHGGALVDALAHGVPLVAVQSIAARQCIADGFNGRVVPADPESEFPRRAFQIFEDTALAARYAAGARQRAATIFDPRTAAAGYVAAVERALG